MSSRINIGPVTRVNGLWHLKVEIEDHVITDAWSMGTNFKGFEQILMGRDPRDAPYLSQRICGICSSAHALGSSLAFERAFDLKISRNGALLRNLIFGADMLQSHLRYFYLFMLADYVILPDVPPLQPGYVFEERFTAGEKDQILKNYYGAMEITQTLHEMAVIFGGKVPHNHGIVIGGATVPPDAGKVRMFDSMLSRVHAFIKEALIPDLKLLTRAYPEYFEMGETLGNLLTFGLFLNPDKPQETFFPSGVIKKGQKEKLDKNLIVEHVKYSYFQDGKPLRPREGETVPQFQEGMPYSWIKAPRYGREVVETGPLARLMFRGKYNRGISAMDRIAARGLESMEVVKQMGTWVQELEPEAPVFVDFDIPDSAEGEGHIDVIRGALLHSVKVRYQKIDHYQVITPTAWNCSPRDNEGRRGALEEALIGTPIEDLENPVEIGRVARSFDVCGSCAVQMVKPDRKKIGSLKII